MKLRTIVTVVILAFVAVSVGYLVIKEVRGARAPEVALGSSKAASAATGEKGAGPGEKEVSTAPATGARGDEAPEEGTAPDRKVTVTYYYTSKR